VIRLRKGGTKPPSPSAAWPATAWRRAHVSLAERLDKVVVSAVPAPPAQLFFVAGRASAALTKVREKTDLKADPFRVCDLMVHPSSA
jgi:hypothetical protein